MDILAKGQGQDGDVLCFSSAVLLRCVTLHRVELFPSVKL